MTDLKTLSILGDIMNNAQAVAGLHAHAAANLNQAGMGNQNQAQAVNQGRACKDLLTCMLQGLAIVIFFVCLCLGIYYGIEYKKEIRRENRRILLEKFDIQPDLWKNLTSARDNATNITEESSVEDFQASWTSYFKAKSYVAKYKQYGPLLRTQGDWDTIKEFSQFEKIMEFEIRNILKDTFRKSKTRGEFMNIAKRIAEENKSVEGLNLKDYVKIMQEAYIKRVAMVFELKPEDLETTCQVLETCHFLKPASETNPESKIIADEF